MANLRTNNLSGEQGQNAIRGSLFFAEDSGDKLSVPNSADVRLGSNDFTVEAWVKFGNVAGSWDSIIGMWDHTNTRRTFNFQRYNTDGELYLYVSTDGGNSNWAYAKGGNLTINHWHHVAGVRDGNTLRVYQNGVQVGTASYSDTILNNTTDALFIGDVQTSDTNNMNGFISNVRLINGTCIYPNGTTFTPPQHELTLVPNTVVLACQDSDNALQEATGKTVTGRGRYADSSIELVTNPSFNNGTTGWTLSDANEGSMAVVNGSLVLTNDDSSDPPVYAWQAVTLVVGQKYVLKVHFSGGTGTPGSNLAVYLNTSSSFGGSAGGQLTADGSGIKTMEFTASAATTYVLLRVNANAAGTSIFSTVSIKAADHGDAPKVIPPYGVDAGNTFGGSIQQSSQGYMYFPTGRTEERGRGVGLYAGGTTPSTDPTSQIASILIQSSGNSIQFGDLSVARYPGGTGASSTRGIWAGGATPTRLNTIDFVTIATTGNATDFGDTQNVVGASAGVSNSTRMVNAGGDNPSPTLASVNVMDLIIIGNTGNGTDFGDLSVARATHGAAASPTRGLFAGGWTAVPAYTASDTIDFVTIATTGNAQDFGNLTTGRRSVSGGSSQTRAIFMGGKSGSNPSSTKTNIIDFVTIASTGDATDFGDLTATVRDSGNTMSNSIRACKAAGYNSPATVNNIDMVTIATTGDAVDFGDTVIPVFSLTGLSDSHGGLS